MPFPKLNIVQAQPAANKPATAAAAPRVKFHFKSQAGPSQSGSSQAAPTASATSAAGITAPPSTDDDLWDGDVDDALLVQASQMAEMKAGENYSEDDIIELTKMLEDDDDDWSTEAPVKSSTETNKRFNQTMTVVEETTVVPQRNSSSISRAAPSAHFHNNFGGPFVKPPPPKHIPRLPLSTKLGAQQQSEGAEIQRLREELQKTQAEIGVLSTEKFQKQGEVTYLRGELSKREKALEKERQDRAREVDLKQEQLKQLENSKNFELDRARTEMEFMRQDIRQLREKATRAPSSQQQPSQSVSFPVAQIGDQQRRKRANVPDGIDRSLLDNDQLVAPPKRPKKLPELNEKGVQTTSARKRKRLLRTDIGGIKDNDGGYLLEALQLSCGSRALDLLLDHRDGQGEVEQLTLLLAKSSLASRSRELQRRIAAIVADTCRTMREAKPEAGVVVANLMAASCLVDACAEGADLQHSDLIADLLERAIELEDKCLRDQVMCHVWRLLEGCLRKSITDGPGTYASIVEILRRASREAGLRRDLAVLTDVLQFLAVAVSNQEMARCLCQDPQSPTCFISDLCSAVITVLNTCKNGPYGDVSSYSGASFLPLATAFVHFLSSSMSTEAACAWVSLSTRARSCCSADVLSAAEVLCFIIVGYCANLSASEMASEAYPLARLCITMIYRMSSSNNGEFVRVLSNTPSLQRQFLWISNLLERMRAAVNFPPDEGFILDEIHVEYDDGTGLNAF